MAISNELHVLITLVLAAKESGMLREDLSRMEPEELVPALEKMLKEVDGDHQD